MLVSQEKSKKYRPCVGVFLVNQENKVFVGKRIDDEIHGAWQMPQGGIDKGEEPLEAAKRELEEETSIKNIRIIKETEEWFHYDLPKHLQGKVWKGKFCGQKQKWFFAKFIGDEKEINLNTTHPEFKEWQWIKPEFLTELVIPFKKKLYENIIECFKDLIF